ncbi:uncharacterized protein TNCV_132591 [Trichonephila clavipes]|nr:uncharacterized protein TNCV_132591 [Trichonephila clavipes]
MIIRHVKDPKSVCLTAKLNPSTCSHRQSSGVYLQGGNCVSNLPAAIATRGLLATDIVILNHGHVTRTTLQLAPPLLTTTPHQREDVKALDRFNVHRSPTRYWARSHDMPTMIRYLDHWATIPPPIFGETHLDVTTHNSRSRFSCQYGIIIGFSESDTELKYLPETDEYNNDSDMDMYLFVM